MIRAGPARIRSTSADGDISDTPAGARSARLVHRGRPLGVGQRLREGEHSLRGGAQPGAEAL